jgi:hypothetical protein
MSSAYSSLLLKLTLVLFISLIQLFFYFKISVCFSDLNLLTEFLTLIMNNFPNYIELYVLFSYISLSFLETIILNYFSSNLLVSFSWDELLENYFVLLSIMLPCSFIFLSICISGKSKASLNLLTFIVKDFLFLVSSMVAVG